MRHDSVFLILSMIAAGACGGATDSTSVGGLQSCSVNPSQSQCLTTNPVTPVDSGLRLYAAKSGGRLFGTELDALFGTSTSATYDTLVAKQFSVVVAGNAQKWQTIHPSRATYNFTRGDQMLAFAQANGMKMRGHTLAWYNQNPSWLTAGTWTADTLTQILKDHITSVLTHYKGTIYAWDVVNETFNGDGSRQPNVWSSVIGRGYVETAFRAARAADPAALLFYNDYNLEFTGNKQDSAYAMIQDFKARGVPVDGIGFQGHFQINADGSGMPSRSSMTSTFQRFAALGLKVHITELDIRVRVPGATAAEFAAQAQGYTDVVAACVAVAACDAIVVWGVTDSESWIPGTFPGYGSALLWDGSFNKKTTWTAVKSGLGG